jgi:hypothetical protein
MTAKRRESKTTEGIERDNEEFKELLMDYAEREGLARSERAKKDFTAAFATGIESSIEVKVTKGRAPKEKREKFRELSVPRVNNAARAIRSIGKLSNTYAYKFEANEIAKIISHLRKELDDVEAVFKRALARESKSKGFTLD